MAVVFSTADIADHEHEQVQGCTCFWCEEENDGEAAVLHLTPKGKETVFVPKGDGVVLRPQWCPGCAKKVDDPDACWSCGFSFITPDDMIPPRFLAGGEIAQA